MVPVILASSTALLHRRRSEPLLRLAFKAFDNRSGDEVSADAFTLDHGNLQSWPEGRLIARHVNNQWEVDGRSFLRFECGPSVTCLFETAGDIAERHGPFDGLACVDGVMWAGVTAVAALQDDQWASMVTKKAWPKLRLVSALDDQSKRPK
jgi:hypothetical protein